MAEYDVVERIALCPEQFRPCVSGGILSVVIPKVTQAAVVSVCVWFFGGGFCLEEAVGGFNCSLRGGFQGVLIFRLSGTMSLRELTQGGAISPLSYFRI